MPDKIAAPAATLCKDLRDTQVGSGGSGTERWLAFQLQNVNSTMRGGLGRTDEREPSSRKLERPPQTLNSGNGRLR